MHKLIKDIGQRDRTVLISSHQLGEVEQICDHAGVISNGKLVRQSNVQELLGEKALSSGRAIRPRKRSADADVWARGGGLRKRRGNAC